MRAEPSIYPEKGKNTTTDSQRRDGTGEIDHPLPPSVAQLVEQPPYTRQVVGAEPTARTRKPI